MYKLYKDTKDSKEPYIIVHKKYASQWYRTLRKIPVTFSKEVPADSTADINAFGADMNAFGPLKLIYSGESYPSTEYLKTNHPELLI